MRWLNEKEIAETIPESIARENKCLPVVLVGCTLVIATSNPKSQTLRDKLVYILDQPIRLIARNSDWICARIDAVYLHESAKQLIKSNVDSRFYWANWTWRDGDVFCIKTSGVQSSSHWSGSITLTTDHQDRVFWEWVVTIKSYQRIIDDCELNSIRRIWRRKNQRTPITRQN